MKKLKIGTRGSNLALWQAQYVATQIKLHTDIEVEIIIIKTKGDKILDVALSKIGDKGLFTKEIEIKLLEKEIDLAVHSMKDLPSVLTDGLMIGAVLEREDPRDVFISKDNLTIENLPLGAKIGTSSLRRIAQVKAFRSDIVTVDIRGNVETRIRKMQEEKLDGIILAFAGVKRLNLEHLITQIIDDNIILPAVGQGAIAVEVRQNDLETLEILASINHQATALATTAERAFLRELEGGCQVPIAAYSFLAGEKLNLQGLVASLDGQTVYRSSMVGGMSAAGNLGVSLAQELIAQGALDILDEIKKLGD
ncbi:MAG TPA: hydroxymethylbilane synthase [Syntrophomonadaceae bacterium]|nr:hydroxymethylbilane synthase [Syntrophomonadaceae bacterium]